MASSVNAQRAQLAAAIGYQDALLLATVTVRCTWVLVPALSVARNVTVSAPGLALMILLMSLRFRWVSFAPSPSPARQPTINCQ